VARFGFIVIVPNHLRAFGPPPAVPLTEQQVLLDAFAHVKAEGLNTSSPLYQRVDGSRLGLLGHSFGGIASLRIIEGSCIPPICTTGTFTRPAELKAAALYGTHLVDIAQQSAIPIDTSSVAVALVQGSLDGRSFARYAEMTYSELETPKALINIVGANHFGNTNTNAPPGVGVDPVPQTISQQDSIERSAAWSALFLRAHVIRDPVARWYIFHSGGSSDGSVTVTSARTLWQGRPNHP
jgi:dienelactone hydrolase